MYISRKLCSLACLGCMGMLLMTACSKGDDNGNGISPVVPDTPGSTSGEDSESSVTDKYRVFAAPDGLDSNDGTERSPLSLKAALKKVMAGDTLMMRAGTYSFSSTIKIEGKDGEENKPIVVMAYEADQQRPVLDFEKTSIGTTGLSIRVKWWKFVGFDVCHAGKNGIRVEGNSQYCTFSNLATYENRDTGFQLSGGTSDCTVENCDSYYNVDETNENADGFAIKMDVGTGNKLIGCRSWMNADDGYDGYLRMDEDREVTTTYERCIAYRNGYLKDGSEGKGDGNGFKLGGFDKDSPRRHNSVVSHCMAACNLNKGFDRNSTMGSMTITNCSAYENGVTTNQYNFAFYTGKSAQLAEGKTLMVKNCVSYSSIGRHISNSTKPSEVSNNTWNLNLDVVSADFVNFDPKQLVGKRGTDGSLPDYTFMRPVSGSRLSGLGWME